MVILSFPKLFGTCRLPPSLCKIMPLLYSCKQPDLFITSLNWHARYRSLSSLVHSLVYVANTRTHTHTHCQWYQTILSRAHEILSCERNIFSRPHEILSRAHEILSRARKKHLIIIFYPIRVPKVMNIIYFKYLF